MGERPRINEIKKKSRQMCLTRPIKSPVFHLNGSNQKNKK